MNPMAAASPPLIPSDPRRARLRGHPSGLKGRCAITTVTDLRPALDPGASAAPHPQRHGQHQRRCPPERAALTQNPYKSSLYGSGGLPRCLAHCQAAAGDDCFWSVSIDIGSESRRLRALRHQAGTTGSDP